MVFSTQETRTTLMMILVTAALGGCLSESESLVDSPTEGSVPPLEAGNSPPVISGSPGASALISNSYSFVPTASDPDGDTLSFSVQNRPSWAQFNTTDGALIGTPQLGDVGSYSNIVVSVSDGALTNSLPQFSVNVVQNADGSITLTWTAPTQNDDGSALTNLSAYKFYYGTSPGSYSNQVRINNPGLTTFVIDNLAPATYYVVATAINNTGGESQHSNEAVKQVL